MFCQSGGGRWKAEGQQLAGTEISAFEMCYQPWRGGRNCDGARSMVAVLNNVFLWGLLHSRLVSENLSSLTCCAQPAEAGRPPGQSTQLAGSWCWASWQSLAAMPSAFPFFFPAQFPLNICQRWPMLQQLKPPLPS